ncbi:MAG: hypothetical protein ACE15C_07195 [Phycisphaerae bacterium]
MGNKAGWIIAGAIVVVLGLIIVWLVWFPGHSDATMDTKAPGVLDFKDVKDMGASVDLVIGAEPSGSGNAADDYKKAIDIANANAKAIDALADNQYEKLRGMWSESKRLTDAELAAFKQIDDAVRPGAAKAKMEYILVYTPKEAQVGMMRGLPTKSFQRVADALEALAADCKARKDFAEAEKVLFHEMVLGWHLTNERVRPWMTLKGVNIQESAAEGLEKVYHAQGKDIYAKKLPALQKYGGALEYLGEQINSKTKILWTIRPNIGDVFNIAENDKDRAWRVQAILKLATSKFNVQDRGDRMYIDTLLRGASKSAEPAERAAAKAAMDFTSEGLRDYASQDNEE